MRWIDTAWPMMGAVSLTLGLIYLLVWIRQPRRYGYLLFFMTAASVAVFSIFELRMMRAATPEEYAVILRWAQVPLFTLFVSVVGFVRLYFRSGRMWLGYAAVGLRAVVLILNFRIGANVNFEQVTAMVPVPVWGGDSIYLPVGIANPYAVVAQLSNLLLIWFVADASVALWRQGDANARRRAAVGGTMVVSFLATAVCAALLNLGLIPIPTVLSIAFLGVVVVMAYELGWDVIAAAWLTARLRESEERFRTLVEAAPSAMLVVDAEGIIMLANARAETMFGYVREELIGRSIDMLVPQRLRSLHTGHRQAYFHDLRPRAMGAGRELFASRKDGSELPVEVGLNPMRTSAGTFVLASVVDVSARKQAELEAARQRDEMAHLARVAMLGELSGSLAHELNQPLSAILSNAQAAQRFLARDPPQVDKVSEILADIVKSDKRAGAVITRLRALLRKEEAQHQPVDMNDVVQEVLALMRSDFLSRHVSVRAELAPRLPAVTGDRVQLQQVLVNLLINGCDAMAGCETHRSLVVRSEFNLGGQVMLCVADHGTGIPPENLERIFEPFVTSRLQGLGLGLAVCRSIVKAHGGRLWATNNPGGGATLHVKLPAIES